MWRQEEHAGLDPITVAHEALLWLYFDMSAKHRHHHDNDCLNMLYKPWIIFTNQALMPIRYISRNPPLATITYHHHTHSMQ